MNRPEIQFLIGGSDLEMLTIRRILTANGFVEGENMADLHLQWGAKLSDYKDFFNKKQIFVGIELTQDIDPPPHYINIDHHNENSNKSTSLEQVIELLKNDFGIAIEFTRELQLIAANDKGYFQGMIDMDAIPEEIADIRRRDRQAQGVTVEDEQLAEQSIRNHLTIEKGITVVKSLTSRFSTITDRLYPYSKLLIYTDNELTFYGEDVSILKKRFCELSTNMTIYSGGGEHGFWGISGGNITQKLINQIIKTETMSKDPYSSHIFLLPFKFLVKENNNKKKENCNDLFIDYMKGKWKNEIVETKEETDLRIRTEKVALYNEKKYYHDFVHPVLYSDCGNNNSEKDKSNDNPLINCFSKKVGLIYRITVKRKKSSLSHTAKDNESKMSEYEDHAIDLNIEKVTLDLFKDGIGVFSFHLNYYPESSLKEKDKLGNVLLINQFGRRLYPPFLDLRYNDFNIAEINTELDGTKHRELAESISIIDGKEILISENWNDFQVRLNESYEINFSTYIPKHILYFLNLEELENKYWFEYSEKGAYPEKNEITMQLVLDDRMFVMSWLGAEQLTEKFQNQGLNLHEEKEMFGYVLSDMCKRQLDVNENKVFDKNSSKQKLLTLARAYNGYRYSTNDFWYQYLFVDGSGKTCQNDIMQEQLLEKHTYGRWAGYNTLYGISRYSFVILSAPFNELKKPQANAAFIPAHLQTIYWRMVSMVLVQRAMVLDFSKQISSINISIDNEDRAKQKEVLSLYKAYRDFINKIFHREVTAQEQGIELYDMLQEHLRVEKQAKELEKEFDEMNRLISLVGANQSSARMKIFTILTGVFLIPTFILNLLKNRKFDDLQPIEKFLSGEPVWQSVYLLLFLAGFAFFFTKALLSWTDKENVKLYPESLNNTFNSYRLFRWKIRRWMIFLLIASALLFFYLITFQLHLSYLWVGIFTSILIVLIRATLLTSKTNK